MKRKTRLRICGARRRRFFIRIIVFLSMMSLYSLSFGIPDRYGDPEAAASPLFLGLAVFLVVLFFKKRDERWTARSRQIAAELAEPAPDAPEEALCSAYMRQRRRELRLEALLYLVFAVFAFFWIQALRLIGATDFSVGAGLVVVVPLLLLAALALLTASFLPFGRKSAEKAVRVYFGDPERRRILRERYDRPDHTDERCLFNLHELNAAPTPENARLALRAVSVRAAPRDFAPLVVSFVFFVLIPNLLLAAFIVLCVRRGDQYWMVLMYGIVTLFCDLIWAYLCFFAGQPRGRRQRPAADGQGKGALFVRDRVLSAVLDVDDPQVLLVCFDGAGTFRWQGMEQELQKLRALEGGEVYLLTDDGVVRSVFLPNEAAAAPACAEDGAAPAAVIRPDEASGPAAVIRSDEASGPAAVTRPDEASGPAAVIRSGSSSVSSADFEAAPEDEVWAELLRSVERGDFPGDAELKEAARSRIAHLDPKAKAALEVELNELFNLIDRRIAEIGGARGEEKLSPAERKRMEILDSRSAYLAMGGRGHYEYTELQGIEETLKQKYGWTGAKIRKMKENPFLPIPKRVWLPLLGVGLAGIVGDLVTALIERATGASLTLVYTLLSCVSGYCALSFGGRWIAARRRAKQFRKLQKAYADPNFWDVKVKSLAYRKFRDAVELARRN